MGNKLKEYREAKKLSQGDLAKAVNTSQQNIDRWEKGTIPTDFILPLAKHFGVRLDQLLGVPLIPVLHQDDDDTVWGDIQIHLTRGEPHQFPIDVGTHNILRRFFENGWESGETDDADGDWLRIETMTQRSLLINPKYIKRIVFIGEPEEEPSSFLLREQYEELRELRDGGLRTPSEILPLLQIPPSKEVRRWLSKWTNEEWDYEITHAKICFTDGTEIMEQVEEILARALHSFIGHMNSVQENSFITIGGDIDVTYERIFLRHVMLIDSPKLALEAAWNEFDREDKEEEEEGDEAEGEDGGSRNGQKGKAPAKAKTTKPQKVK